MAWEVRFHRKVNKQVPNLPSRVRSALAALARDIEANGPVRGNWPNYGKLGDKRHHCHLKKGKTTFVAIWEERGDDIHLVEVTYAGSHEKAPYQ
jgi:mRNA-degrading endonuclease RelE of RelBE toxin-antitoxin system